MTQIVWRYLVDVIVEPVGKQQIPVTARWLAVCSGDRFREVVVRHIRIETRFDITEILCREGVWIVFRMAGYKGNTLIFAGKQVSIAIFCFGGISRSV